MESKGIVNSHEYVDLGLSVVWATCNVGASCPDESGDYYAWGETETKPSYGKDNCKTMFCHTGDIDGTLLDVAHVKWSAPWRMPTKKEFDELCGHCAMTWTTQGGHDGIKVTGKNGNSIFLPATGLRDGTSLYLGGRGCYWSSTSSRCAWPGAYHINIRHGKYYWDWFCNRLYGCPVRPVIRREDIGGEKIPIQQEVDKDITEGFYSQPFQNPGVEINGHEYIDLGLSVKWATCNVGASTPLRSGDYFAWGKTKAVMERFPDDDNCKTCERNIGDIGGTDRDVAHVKWGATWRMPTKAEFRELIRNCYWEWTALDWGADGYTVISRKNDNYIFLPTGYLIADAHKAFCHHCGWYWSSTPYGSSSRPAYRLYIDVDGHNICRDDPGFCYFPVRPVSK